MITLGQAAKDKITGFKGILTGRAQYLYGCDQYCLNPSVSKDGKLNEGQWFDKGRIEITGKGILPEEVKALKPGGPQRDAPHMR